MRVKFEEVILVM